MPARKATKRARLPLSGYPASDMIAFPVPFRDDLKLVLRLDKILEVFRSLYCSVGKARHLLSARQYPRRMSIDFTDLRGRPSCLERLLKRLPGQEPNIRQLC